MIDIGRVISYGCTDAPEKCQLRAYDGASRLYYIHSGKGGLSYNGRCTELKAGHLYFIPFLVNAELCSAKEDTPIYTYASFELVPPVISDEILEFSPACDKEAECALYTFLEGGKRQMLPAKGYAHKRAEYSEDFLRLCKSAMAFLTSRIISTFNIRPIEDKIILSALNIMHSSLSENITVESLAKKYFITPDGFIRKFRSEVGITPYSYLKRLRIRTAHFLKEQGESLEKIAKVTGYSDPSSLLHAMKSLK